MRLCNGRYLERHGLFLNDSLIIISFPYSQHGESQECESYAARVILIKSHKFEIAKGESRRDWRDNANLMPN